MTEQVKNNWGASLKKEADVYNDCTDAPVAFLLEEGGGADWIFKLLKS